MNIQERKNKNGQITSYRIRVFDHRDASTGKQVFKTLSVKYDTTKSAAWNRKNAEKQGAVFEKGVEEQTISDARVTFDTYADYFLKIKENSGVMSSTMVEYKLNKKKLVPYIGHIQIKSLTASVLNKTYTELLEDGVTKKYVRVLHNFIHNVLQTALKEGIIPRNYADAASPPKRPKIEVNAIDENDLERFFTKLYADSKHYMHQVFFSVLLASGCRIGELCALTWNNVDFEEGRIHICQHFVNGEDGLHIESGCKTASGERWIYLGDDIMKMLRDYQKYYYETARKYGNKWNVFANAVFFSEKNTGSLVTPNSIRSWLNNFLKKNNLKHFHPHQLRHTSISLQLKAGISIPDAAKRAGHSSPEITLAYYAHSLKKNDKHCSEVVTDVLPKLPKRKVV